ncbi:hypothetical protein [Deinococcus yavapaiensis]|uniref:Uncharacterized protein n=1 Tax=Deinococcus yavapaiensis KR-236 TaxID=694435 RepID=A0A318S9W1_9DEIO|nr:hypothetical protein [Deinococcus yavapaiensis]PYE56210.1 hypothetical protein DES52_10114 [Deinococcus yavapaiensis KR-236]
MTIGTPEVLRELLDFFTPLAKVRRVLRGAAVLHAPAHPVLGANAAYVFDEQGAVRADTWYRAQGAPTVLASASSHPDGDEVLSLRVGTFRALPLASTIVAEQVSRLQVAIFAEVLCDAWNVPDWEEDVARALAAALEGRSDVTLYLAYEDRPVGALLERGGRAHLWGVTNEAALLPLLNAACELGGGEVRTSVPSEHPLALHAAAPVVFSRLT